MGLLVLRALAYAVGLAGGVTRDILLNEVPVALTNPVYVPVALAAGGIAIRLTYQTAEEFLGGALQLFLPGHAWGLSEAARRQRGTSLTFVWRATPER